MMAPHLEQEWVYTLKPDKRHGMQLQHQQHTLKLQKYTMQSINSQFRQSFKVSLSLLTYKHIMTQDSQAPGPGVTSTLVIIRLLHLGHTVLTGFSCRAGFVMFFR